MVDGYLKFGNILHSPKTYQVLEPVNWLPLRTEHCKDASRQRVYAHPIGLSVQIFMENAHGRLRMEDCAWKTAHGRLHMDLQPFKDFANKDVVNGSLHCTVVVPVSKLGEAFRGTFQG